jgi:hypothetical protein
LKGHFLATNVIKILPRKDCLLSFPLLWRSGTSKAWNKNYGKRRERKSGKQPHRKRLARKLLIAVAGASAIVERYFPSRSSNDAHLANCASLENHVASGTTHLL